MKIRVWSSMIQNTLSYASNSRRLMTLVDWLAIFWGGYIVFVTWGEFTLYWTLERAPEPFKTFFLHSVIFVPFIIGRWLFVGSPKLWVYPQQSSNSE